MYRPETINPSRSSLLSLYLLIGLVALLLASSAQRSSQAQVPPPCPGDYAPGIVLIGFRAEASRMERRAVLNRWATAVVDQPAIDAVAVHTPFGQECATATTLKQDPHVTFAELDYAVHATETSLLRKTWFLVPDDLYWPQQWGPAKINAPEAWAIATGASDVIVAVIDSGIRLTHEDLAANLWSNPGETPANQQDDDGNGKVDDVWGWHFYHDLVWNGEEYVYQPLENNQITDDNGHGTHVSGIIGARINNGIGIAGMAGTARLMTLKVLDEYGSGWYSDIARGIIYAVDNGAQVLNISAGGKPSSTVLQEAVNYAHAHGALVVAAAGNRDRQDGYDAVLYPAACEHVLAVAATDQNDTRPSFSNHGPQVDVAAPGVDIYSTWYRGNYFIQSGTSMAAPHVSGLAALIWSARPDLTATQATHVITASATDVNSGTLLLPGWDEYLGWGRVDAGRAFSTIMTQLYLPLIVHDGGNLSPRISTQVRRTFPSPTGRCIGQ